MRYIMRFTTPEEGRKWLSDDIVSENSRWGRSLTHQGHSSLDLEHRSMGIDVLL